MSELMRKIVYYENILEFKENTKSELILNELNNWQLCRTCLIETGADDVDLEKMCVMDALEGRFLNVQEMLINTTGLEISRHQELPLKVCKGCLSKITTLYYFNIQVRKAEIVLKRLANKLKNETNKEDIFPDNVQNLSNISPEESFNNENFLKSNNETKDVSIEMNIQDDVELDDVQCMSDNDQMNCESREPVDCLENSEELCEHRIFLNDQQIATDIKITDYLKGEPEEEIYLDSDSHDTVEVGNNEEISKSEYTDDVIILTAEQFEDNSNTNDSQQLQILEMDNQTETIKHKRLKLKQPRVKKPLLDNIKCEVCKQIFRRQRDLVKHVKEFHPNSKAFKCRDCGMLFSHMQSLSRHMNTHKDLIIKNTCEFCSKSFLRVDDLKRHVRVHTGERPYVCSLCDKAFKQQGEKKAHQLTHFPLSVPLACDQCDRVFTSRNGLYLHKKTHHTEEKKNK